MPEWNVLEASSACQVEPPVVDCPTQLQLHSDWSVLVHDCDVTQVEIDADSCFDVVVERFVTESSKKTRLATFFVAQCDDFEQVIAIVVIWIC